MLEAINLACVRGDRTLFRGVSLSAGPGEAVRLAGENGSGKTSLLRILTGLSAPAEGDVRWNGEPIRAVREEFGRALAYVAHANGVKDELNPVENLMFAGAIAGEIVGEEAAKTALRRVGLVGRDHLPTRYLSQGQKRRVSLARLFITPQARLWLLDEPFTALDVKAVGELAGVIGEHLGRGGAVVFTTHQEVPVRGGMLKTVVLG